MSDIGIPAALVAGDSRPRLRVDVAQTGFFEGREFRTFYEFNIAAGESVTGRFVCPVNFILFGQTLTVDDGSVRMTVSVGGTTTGTFGDALPVVGKNQMTTRPAPYYSPEATIATGGSVSGGDVLDVARVVAAKSTAQRSTVGGQVSDERGLPPGTYYITLSNIGSVTATGVYSAFWEERPG